MTSETITENTSDTQSTKPNWPARVSVGIFRVLILVNVFMLLVQPVLIGQFMDGRSNWLDYHYSVGVSIMSVGTFLLLAAVLTWWFASWSIAVIPIVFVIVTLEGIQVSTGIERNLGIHVPLGVLLVGMIFGLSSWSRKQPTGPMRKLPFNR